MRHDGYAHMWAQEKGYTEAGYPHVIVYQYSMIHD